MSAACSIGHFQVSARLLYCVCGSCGLMMGACVGLQSIASSSELIPVSMSTVADGDTNGGPY